MKYHRALIGNSVEIHGIVEWKAALKKHGYTQDGNLRGAHVFVYALNSEGKLVGTAGHGGHGGLYGYVSDSPESFKIDWIDEVVRLQESRVLGVERWKNMTNEEVGVPKETFDAIVQRHIDGLPRELAALDECIRLRREDV